MNTDEFDDWVGKSEHRKERIAPFPANALAATLDRDDPDYVDGSALPPLWHWMHFLPVFNLSEAGYDGHAALGGFLPPVPLPRRMWAGGRLRFDRRLVIGRHLEKVSTVRSVNEKTGRSGRLVFVTVGHEIFDDGVLCLEEEHDIVYREEPDPSAIPPSPISAPEKWSFSRSISPDPVLLFRYSALTFNGHRIHYDQPFCTTSEGYSGLVVHGPLLATLLVDLLRREMPEATLKHFEFRALSTIFDTQPFSIHGAPRVNGEIHLWARRGDGALAMEAKAWIE